MRLGEESIGELPTNGRTYAALNQAGILTIQALCLKSSAELLPLIGEPALRDVQRALERYRNQFRLRDDK